VVPSRKKRIVGLHELARRWRGTSLATTRLRGAHTIGRVESEFRLEEE
jgi:hypothetical protein